MDLKNRSLVLDFWERVFYILSFISVFKVIQLIKKKVSYRFVELWVISNLILSLVSSILVFYTKTSISWFFYPFMVYGALRIFEIIIYQINVLLFDPYRSSKKGVVYRVKSPTRLVVLLFHNYFEIICWFSVILIAFLNMNNNLTFTWGEYLKLNFFYITTFNTSGIIEIYKDISGGASFVMFESIVGYIITLVTMARFIGLLPPTESIDDV